MVTVKLPPNTPLPLSRFCPAAFCYEFRCGRWGDRSGQTSHSSTPPTAGTIRVDIKHTGQTASRGCGLPRLQEDTDVSPAAHETCNKRLVSPFSSQSKLVTIPPQPFTSVGKEKKNQTKQAASTEFQTQCQFPHPSEQSRQNIPIRKGEDKRQTGRGDIKILEKEKERKSKN